MAAFNYTADSSGGDWSAAVVVLNHSNSTRHDPRPPAVISINYQLLEMMALAAVALTLSVVNWRRSN